MVFPVNVVAVMRILVNLPSGVLTGEYPAVAGSPARSADMWELVKSWHILTAGKQLGVGKRNANPACAGNV